MKQLLLLVALVLALASAVYGQTVSGSITATDADCRPTSCVSYVFTPQSNTGSAAVQVTGTFVATLQFEASLDETGTFVAIAGAPVATGTAATSTTTTGVWQFSAAGLRVIRVRASAYTSGTASVSVQSSTAASSAADSGTVAATQSGTWSSRTQDGSGNLITSTTSGSDARGLAVNVISGSGLTITQGTAATTTGWPFVIAACSGATCYTSGVNSGLVTLASGSTSTIFASTVLVQSLRCNNSSGGAVVVHITDGNNAYFVGPSYSLAANSNVEFAPSPNGSLLTSGLRASAGTASAVNCWVTGKIAP